MPAQTFRSENLMVEALQDGAEDARRAVEAIAPAVSAAVTSTLYGTSFAVSFGVCFAGMLLGRLVPQTSPLAIGAQDGFRAARTAVDSLVPREPSNADTLPAKRIKRKKAVASVAQRTRGEVTATAMRITEDTSTAHV